jgi:3-methyladenine DNA glycosylase AlkD
MMIKNIQKELKRLGNKEYATRLQKYFKTGKGEYGEGDRFLGIQVPVLRKIVKKYRNISIDEASELIKSPFHEERLLSIFLMVELFKSASDKEKEKIFTIYLSNTKFINNWDLVDASAGHIVGNYLFTRDKKPIYLLAGSKNVWERRISIMSTSYFIGNNKFVDALKIAEMLLGDEDDLIHKAVGWMLREIGKRDFELEERFLEKYYKIMPRTMLRYAIEKFPEEIRKSYLKGEL